MCVRLCVHGCISRPRAHGCLPALDANNRNTQENPAASRRAPSVSVRAHVLESRRDGCRFTPVAMATQPGFQRPLWLPASHHRPPPLNSFPTPSTSLSLYNAPTPTPHRHTFTCKPPPRRTDASQGLGCGGREATGWEGPAATNLSPPPPPLDSPLGDRQLKVGSVGPTARQSHRQISTSSIGKRNPPIGIKIHNSTTTVISQTHKNLYFYGRRFIFYKSNRDHICQRNRFLFN